MIEESRHEEDTARHATPWETGLGRILENSLNEIYLFDAEDLRFLHVNRGGRKNLGYTMEDLSKLTPIDLKPEFTKERLAEILEPLRNGSTREVEFETIHRRKDGSSYDVEIHVQLSKMMEKSCFVAMALDITQRKRSEGFLRESEAKLQAIVDTAVDAMVTIDPRGNIESFNTSSERMFGYSASEAIGRNVKILMPAPYHEAHDRYIAAYLRSGVKRIIGIGRQILGLRRDGSTFPAELSVSEIKLDGCHLFTGIIHDISERRALEKEVLEISTEEQKRISRDLHDGLGQELTGIAFLAGALEDQLSRANRSEAARARTIVELANQAIEHTRALVKGLCPVNLQADGLMIALGSLAEQSQQLHGTPCTFKCPTPVLVLDHIIAMHVYYIALEAVTNAVRHSKARHIKISLSLQDRRCTLTVQDDGSGLPAEKQGDGRGMHIMRYRADSLAGTLEVAPGDPKGTTLMCTFLLDRAEKATGEGP